MPRTARPHAPGAIHHLISRFVNAERRMDAPGSRAFYLERCGDNAPSFTGRIFSYALMGTHVHWGAEDGEEPVEAFLQPLHTAYAQWSNAKEGRFGPTFAGRPTTRIVHGEEALARLVAYHANNPVRAGVVRNPADSDWTSHQQYIGERPSYPWLDVEWALAMMGFSCSPSGRLAFHDYVCSRSHLGRDPRLSGSGPLPREIVGALVRAVAVASGTAPIDFVRRRPGPTASRVQELLVHVGAELFGAPRDVLASALGVSASQVSVILRRARSKTPDARMVERVVEDMLDPRNRLQSTELARNGGAGLRAGSCQPLDRREWLGDSQ